MMKQVIVCALICLSGMGLNRCAAAESVTNPVVTSVKNKIYVNVTATATVSGLTANTPYKIRFVAVDAAKKEILLEGGTKLMSLMDGTIKYQFGAADTILQFATTYDFVVKVFDQKADPATAVPLCTGTTSYTTAPNVINCRLLNDEKSLCASDVIDHIFLPLSRGNRYFGMKPSFEVYSHEDELS